MVLARGDGFAAPPFLKGTSMLRTRKDRSTYSIASLIGSARCSGRNHFAGTRLEALESRTLLNGDLAIAFVQVPTTGTYLQGDRAQAVVSIVNHGPNDVRTSGDIQIYASLDGSLNPSDDILLGSLRAGGTVQVNDPIDDLRIALKIPAGMNPGSYRLIATVVPASPIPGDNPANNIAVTAGPVINLPASFGQVGNRANVKLVLFDDELNTPVTLTLTGGGTGTLVPNGDGFDVSIADSGPNSVLSVKTLKNIAVTAQNINVDGSLKTINAPTVNLAGNLAVSGSLGSLTLNDVADDHTITIGAASGSNKATTIRMGNVAEASVTTQMPIKSLTVDRWTDQDETPDMITAPSIASIKSIGRFDAGLTIAGSGAGLALGAVNIGGDVSGAEWAVAAGPVGSIQIGGEAGHWTLTTAAKVNTLKLASLVNSNISLESAGSITLSGDLTQSTVTFTRQPTSGNDRTTAINSLTVKGTVDHSTIASNSWMGKATLGAMVTSNLFAGVNGPGLPDAAGQFNLGVTLKLVKITGIKGSVAPAFAGSNVAAWTIGSVTLKGVDTSSEPAPFGIAANAIGTYSRTDASDAAKRKFKALNPDKLPDPPSLLTDGNFVIRVVA